MSKWKWINDLLNQRKISQNDFAQKIKWNQARVSELLSDKRDIPVSKLYDIANFFQIDLGQLTAYNSGKSTLIPVPNKLNILEGLFAKNNSTGTVQIDIISATACCGSGNEILAEDITGHWIIPQADFHTLPFSAAPNNIKMLRVSGDSMEPTLKDGDWILADISRKSPDSDGIYLLQLSTGLAVKRLQGSITPDTVIIKSDNPVYNPENANLKDVIILGRVIYILKTEKVG